MRSEGLRLRTALVVEWNVGLALEAAICVPCRAPVPDADQFHQLFLDEGRALVRDEEIVHVVGVLFLDRQDALEHDP